MDNFYGIGTCPFSAVDERGSRQRSASHDSSISLEDYAKAVQEHYNQHSTTTLDQNQTRPQSPLKSPLFLMPIELGATGGGLARPASPMADCPLLSSAPSTPSMPAVRPFDVWARADESGGDRLARLALAEISNGVVENGVDQESVDSRFESLQAQRVHAALSSQSLDDPDRHLAKMALFALHGLIALTAEDMAALEPPHYADQLGKPIPYGQPQSDLPYSVSVQARTAADERSDSSLSDLSMPEGLPAARHMELDRMLKDAGITGLGDCSESRTRYSRLYEAQSGLRRVFRGKKKRRRSKMGSSTDEAE